MSFASRRRCGVATFMAIATGFVIGAPQAAAAETETIYGVIDVAGAETLVTFTTTSGTVTTVGPISGLPASENIVSMDFRPATGQLYALTLDGATEEINVISGINTATPAATPFATTPALSLTGSGEIDFNPVPDAIRVISSASENLRIPIATGAIVTDAPLTGAGNTPSGAAYTNASQGTQQSTLYDIDDSTLYRQGGLQGVPSPNAGAMTSIGALGGVNFEYANGGFDVSPNTGTAYTLRNVSSIPTLFRVDLGTGAATVLVNTSDSTTHAIAVAPAAPALYFSSATSTVQAPTLGIREDAGSAVLTVRRTGNINATPSFTYSITPGTASADDIGPGTPAGSIAFAAGETSKQVNVPIVNDETVEGNETFTVAIAPTGASTGTPGNSTVTIFDNDPTTVATDPTVVTVPGPPAAADQVLLIAAPSQIMRTALLRRGLPLEASCAEACTVSYELKLGSRSIGTAAGALASRGVGSVNLRLTAAGKRAVTTAFRRRSVRSKRIVLSGSATDSDGGAAATRSKTIAVTR